jgi:hypothetical protein
LIAEFNVWLIGAFILLVNLIIIFSLSSLATNSFNLKFFAFFFITWGVNFFIPFFDQYFKRLLNSSL